MTRNSWRGLQIISVVGLAWSVAAQGAVIYDNGGPDQVYGTQMSEFQVAEDFTIGSAANIDNIRFWSIQEFLADYTGSVFWAIYSDAPGEPAALVQGGVTAAVAATATGNSTGFGYAEYVFDIPVAFTLSAGNYWLGLHNGSLATTTPTEMLWSTTATPVGSAGLYLDTGSWIDSGNEHAFRLDGTVVPIPTAVWLFGSALGLIGVMRRKLTA